MEDFYIDNILQPKPKKINSKKKGNRSELQLTKILTKRFNKPFSRSVGSGNRWGQVSNMPDHAKTTLTGDICPPERFKWVIESKCGYEDTIDLNGIFEGSKGIDKFIEQSLKDSKQSGRLPIIVWKRNFKPWLAMIQKENLPNENYLSCIHYKDWAIILLEDFLKQPDSYFFYEETKT